jgi:4-amino-4-deoxy-L-arabinose transferase-like glycosyltransferase
MKTLQDERVLLAILFSVAISYRMWGVTNPLLDYHSWRQTATASIARNFYEGGMNIFRPRLDTIAEETGKTLSGIEFQLYPFLVAALYFIFGVHETIGRLVSIGFGLGGMWYLYLLARKYYGKETALYASLFYAVLPMMVYYTRTFQPEATMIFFSVASLYYFSEWVDDERSTNFYLSMLFSLLSYLVKIPTLYMLFPLLFLAIVKFGWRSFFNKHIFIFLLVTLIPSLLWYAVSPKIIGSASLLKAEGKWATVRILLDLDFYRHIFLTRIAEKMFAFTGFPLVLTGLLLKVEDKKQYLFHVWLFAVILYILVTAQGNAVHEYYQVPIILPGVVFMGRAVPAITGWIKNIQAQNWLKNLSFCGLLFSVAFIPFHSIYKLRSRLSLDLRPLELARPLKNVSKEKDLVIVYDEDQPEVFYYSHRKGWHVGNSFTPQSLEEKRIQGAKFFAMLFPELVTKNRRLYDYLNSNYSLAWKGTNGSIFDLTTKVEKR